MRKAQRFDEELRKCLGVEENPIASVIPAYRRVKSEEIAGESNEVFEAFVVGSSDPEIPLYQADMTITDEIAQEGGQVRVHLIRNRNRLSWRRQDSRNKGRRTRRSKHARR